MFYYRLFVAFIVVTVGLSIEVRRSLIDEPERCCRPKQFSSKISVTFVAAIPDAKTYTSYAYYNYSYDASRGMAAMKGVEFPVPDGRQTKLWIIQNITSDQMYVLDLDTKQCDKSRILIKPFNCIPDSATFIQSSSYGYDNKQIIGDTWLIKTNQTISYSTVSRNDCVPLTDNMFLQLPDMINSVTTTDFVPHIDDPSIFDIPAECKSIV